MTRAIAAIDSALRAFRSNLFRSAMTMIGLIIGIASVLAIGAVGSGLRGMIQDQLERYDASLLIVAPQAQGAPGQRAMLRERDAHRLRLELSGIRGIGTELRSTVRLAKGNSAWNSTLAGMDEDMFVLQGRSVEEGRALTPADYRLGRRVALIGATAAHRLFGAESPVGREIRVNGVPVRLIGRLADEGAGFAGDPDDLLVAPIQTARKRIVGGTGDSPFDAVSGIWMTFAEGDSAGNRARAAEIIGKLHPVRAGAPAPFAVRSMEDQLSQASAAVAALNVGLSVIASISLFVAGIGIMNTMLASVAERTREIGLRRAVGASAADIRNQFLIEAMVLCAIGGAIGILAAIALVQAIAFQLPDWPLRIDAGAVLGTFAVALAVGTFFGVVPAMKASRLDPAAALRTE